MQVVGLGSGRGKSTEGGNCFEDLYKRWHRESGYVYGFHLTPVHTIMIPIIPKGNVLRFQVNASEMIE